MELVEQIKRISIKAYDSTNPVNVYVATVTSLSPLTVRINPKLELSSQLIITNTISELMSGYYVGQDKTQFLTSPTTSDDGITPGDKITLSVGDKVLVVRVQGGQKFAVIDKVI